MTNEEFERNPEPEELPRGILCPLSSLRKFSTGFSCQRESCAWWDELSNRCSIVSIAKGLRDHTVEVLRDI